MTLSLQPPPVPLKVDRDGVARVAGTRVTLDTVVAAFADGATAEEIAQQYPSLSLTEVYGVITYYLANKTQVDHYLAERSRQAEQVRTENQARFPNAGIRQRLIARRKP